DRRWIPGTRPRLVGRDLELPSDEVEEFARLQQEVRVARASEPLLADRERLDDQHTAVRDALDDGAESRSPQGIGHHDAVEAASLERPGAVLEVRFDDLDAPARTARAQLLEGARVAIDADDREAGGEQPAHVPAAAARDVEHAAVG